MFLSAVAPLLLLPYAAAAGVHKLKLKKLDITLADINPSLESAYLAEKYGAQTPAQMPLFGSGGQGRRLDSRPTPDDLYWTQEEITNGGHNHNVPLTSSLPFSLFLFSTNLYALLRLHECSVLYRDLTWDPPSEGKLDGHRSR
jgi:saccharopepsin